MHWVGLLGFFCLYENKIGSKLIYHKDNKKKIKASKQKCILPWGSAYLWRMLEISKLSALLSHTTYSISPFFKMSETEKKKKKKKKKLFEAPYVASHSRSGSCLFFFEHLTDVLMLSAVFLFPMGQVAAESTGRAVRGQGCCMGIPGHIHPHSHSSQCWLGPRSKFLVWALLCCLDGSWMVEGRAHGLVCGHKK